MRENLKSSISQFKDGDAVILILQNGSIQPVTQDAPHSFYVRGHIQNMHIIPDGRQISGEGDLAAPGQGTPGWFELGSGNFFPMQTARAPTTPYINGLMTKNGFVPSSRDIH